MTATTINGVQVLESEAIEAPISTPDRRVYFKQIRRLLLADGAEHYGCIHCPFTSPKIGLVRTHLKEHRTRDTTPATPPKSPKPSKAKPSPTPAKTDPLHVSTISVASLSSLNLGELVERAQATNQAVKQRDLARKERDAAREALTSWMDRAKQAEHKLSEVQRALQP
ncbi:hypothetical protein [Streptomyces sp. NBC_01244]|uniref:hypothetical protein n=1 Tax=Streptomyces sp. NBC_01244 TaxID=2903797 RepID=UPI002E153684|nr:hypothetical protein OG247_44125 [Streptomyces sp. NBC_01244]